MKNNLSSPFLTVSEVAAYFRVTSTTVIRWLHSGKLRGENIGTTKPDYRIYASSVHDVPRSVVSVRRAAKRYF